MLEKLDAVDRRILKALQEDASPLPRVGDGLKGLRKWGLFPAGSLF